MTTNNTPYCYVSRDTPGFGRRFLVIRYDGFILSAHRTEAAALKDAALRNESRP